MAGKNKTRLVGWHPKDDSHVAWLEAEVERRGGGRGVRSGLLDEMLAAFIASQGSNYGSNCAAAPDEPASPPRRTRKPRAASAPATTFREPESASDIMAAIRRRRNGGTS